ncbi:FAD:protein FMN transferase [Sphingobacterium suaedae]|uniref:FAD:protein FMN transferase n=1 Tax=Sphingobacterium suaedae TaxID=1686402 RepID=A0ABW5KGT8_9SPHI
MRGIFIWIFVNLGCCAFAQQPKFVIDGLAQGTTYRMSYFAPKEVVEKYEIDSILRSIDESMSLYKQTSRITQFNSSTADEGFMMDPHMKNVVHRSIAVYRESDGLFDITVKPLVGLWGFGPERIGKAPTAEQIDSVLTFVGMKKLKLRKGKLWKTDPRVSIDLNGIAQGYSVDVLADFLEDRGVTDYIVELGGEIRTKGYKEGHQPFEVAIERPIGAERSTFMLQLTDKAVTTSGNYRRAFDFEGRKIHHHINPFDGYPLQNSVASVTVLARTAMDADAYDNVFMALSPQEGVRLADRLKNIEVYIIYKDGETFKELFSKGFSIYIKN